MRTTFRVIVAAFALLLATPALGASEFDIANAEHDANTGASNGAKRVTIVDSAGTSVIGTGGGIGSRVELLASGTSTSASTLVRLFGTSGAEVNAELPAWCSTLQFRARIAAISGTPANMRIVLAAVEETAYYVQSGAIATPAALVEHIAVFGADGGGAFSVTSGAASGASSQMTASLLLPRNFRILATFTAAPDTVSIVWSAYCIGG